MLEERNDFHLTKDPEEMEDWELRYAVRVLRADNERLFKKAYLTIKIPKFLQRRKK